MKIVVAFDKFKGSLSAPEACAIVQRALRASLPGAKFIARPMADGGEGTAAVLKVALGGQWIFKRVTGPRRPMKVRARYLWLPRKRFAVVELAQATGLVLLRPSQRNPLFTTTYGTGELLADARRRGARHIWLAVGGSATVDGGVGAAMALGWKILDADGRTIGLGGGALQRIKTIVAPTPLGFPKLTVLCDVTNPLCGKHGAAAVFGPQKGANKAMVRRLDAGLRRLAGVVKSRLGKDIRTLRGGGAAGGMAAGAAAFLNAKLSPGIQSVIATTGLRKEIADADWLITGEGQFDEQSLRGKVVAGLSALAKASGGRVAVLAGRVRLTKSTWRKAGVDVATAITPSGLDTKEAMKRSKVLLSVAAKRLAKMLLETS
jgi:glycerate kinase